MAFSLFSLDKRRGGASKAFGKVLPFIALSGTSVAATFSGASVSTDLFDIDFGLVTSLVSALETVLSKALADSDGCAEVCDAALDLGTLVSLKPEFSAGVDVSNRNGEMRQQTVCVRSFLLCLMQ
jgi:hypothetical protein